MNATGSTACCVDFVFIIDTFGVDGVCCSSLLLLDGRGSYKNLNWHY